MNTWIKKEVEALRNLKHNNVVKLVEIFTQSKNQQLVVVMEYLSGGELYDYWKRFKNCQIPEVEV